ncbi:hypothetical protein PV11_08439 [Exophiala sideris]|uniref:Uncharacterized protein n=1 Tax=Exophiala sideris TaxID=1016849 RepID=A0A0D1YJ12_9EURO|nr:hypothetical protein PV11_08439 [Exophiala sideris]
MLMAGVVSLANASNILQVAFAAAYIVLNGIYWTVSALNPFRFHWRHSYKTHVLNIAPLPTGRQDHPVKKKSHVKRTIKTFRHEWHRFQISWGLIDPATRAPTMPDPSPTGARNFTAALWTAIVLTGTSQWLNEATTIAPVNDAWKKWLSEAGGKVQPIDEHEGRFEMHRTSGISHSIQRMPTGTDWRFIRAADTPEANHTRRIIIREQIGSWEYNKRLTAILAEHAPKTRKPYPDETDETVAPVIANNESAQGTSSAVEAPPGALSLARRLTGLINSSTPPDSNTQTVLSTSTDVEKAYG